MTRVLPHDMFTPIYKINSYEKNFYTRRTFRYGSYKYGFLVFFLGGLLFTDKEFYTRDDFMARPDLNCQRIMTGEIPDKERKVFEIFNGTNHGTPFDDQPKSWVKRFKAYFYKSADYNPHSSYYLPFYDYKKRSYHPDDVSSYYSIK